MTLPIRGTSLGNPQDAARIAIERGARKPGDLVRYAVALWADCGTLGLRADCAFSQADLETGTFTSARWVNETNPAGISITNDKPASEAGPSFSPETWARVHATHIAGYAGITPPAEWIALDIRWPHLIRAGYFGVAATMQDLDERWAVDGPQQYGDVIERRWRNYSFPTMRPASDDTAGDGGNEGRPVMGYTAHDWSHIGFPGGKVYLPDDITVQIKIIPSSVPGWTSGQKHRGHTKTTWHDTGNPSSTAASEWGWAANGGRANINSPGSYNGIFDRTGIIISQRFDEMVGHAGTPAGNYGSWAFEQAFGNGYDGGLRVGAALHGGICAAMGWAVDTHMVKHQYWTGKWCPGQTLNRNLWSHVVKLTSDAALAAAGAATGGKIPDDAPVYAKPVPIPELLAFNGKPDSDIPYRVNGDGWVALYVADRVRAIRDTPRRRYSSGDELVGGPVKAGEEFDVDWLLISADFPDTYLTPWLTRIAAADTARVADVKQDATPAQGG